MKPLVPLALGFLALFSTGLAKFNAPIKKIRGNGAYLKGTPDAGRARIEFLRSNVSGLSSQASVQVSDTGLGYTTSVGIGEPPTYYDLVIDTGRANTWIGGSRPYVRTSSSRLTGNEVSIPFFDQQDLAGPPMKGREYIDTVTLAPGLVITGQSIGVADNLSFNIAQVDGTIGFGPMGLSQGTLSNNAFNMVSDVMSTLVSEHNMDKILSIFVSPAEIVGEGGDQLTYGGVDPSLYVGDLKYFSLSISAPASNYWAIDVWSCTFGDTISLASTAVVDTGLPLIYLADNLFEAYLKRIPGAKIDPKTNLVEIPDSSIKYIRPLTFTFLDGAVDFTLDPSAQLVPTDQNFLWGGDEGKIYGLISWMGIVSYDNGEWDYTLGLPFLRRFYTVLDAKNQRVGFAKTIYS